MQRESILQEKHQEVYQNLIIPPAGFEPTSQPVFGENRKIGNLKFPPRKG